MRTTILGSIKGGGQLHLEVSKRRGRLYYLEVSREGENGNIKQKGTLLFLYYADEFMSFCSCLVSSIVGIWGRQSTFYFFHLLF